MQKTEERDFTDDEGTIRVQTTQLAALRAFKLMGRLGKLLGPAMAHLRGIKLTTDVAQLAPVFASLFENLDPGEAESLALQILEGSQAITDKVTPLSSAAQIDRIFGGRLLTMCKVLAFAVEVNFRDFFRGLAPAAAAAVANTPENP